MPRRIAGFAVGLLALFGFVVLYGLLTGYKYTISPVLNGIAWMLSNIRIRAWRINIAPFAFLSKAIRDVDVYVAGVIGHGALRCEKIAVRFFHALAHLGSLLGHLLGDLATDTLRAFHYLRHRLIPRLIHAAVSVLRRFVMKVWRWLKHAVAAVLHRLLRFIKWARHVVGSLWHHIAGLYKWARHALARVYHQLAGIWKWIRHTAGWFSKRRLLEFAAKVMHWLGIVWILDWRFLMLARRVLRWSWSLVQSMVYAFGKVDGNTTVEVFAKVAQEEVHTVVRVLELLLADFGTHKVAPRYDNKLPPTV